MSDATLRAVPDPDDPDSFVVPAGPRRRSNGKLTLGRQNALMRALALADKRDFTLAKEFGVNRTYVHAFRKKYAYEINQIKKDLDNEFVHIEAANKVNRVAGLDEDMQILKQAIRDLWESRGIADTDMMRCHALLSKQVAEEMGQLAPRQIQASGAGYTYRLIGFSQEEVDNMFGPAKDQP